MAEGARDRAAVGGSASTPVPALRQALRRDAPARRIGLARDPWRIIAWLGVRLAIGEVGILVGLSTRGTIGTAVLVVGVTVLAYVVLLTLHVLTLRLEVATDELHVVSWLTRRRYRLREGQVRRLAVDARRGVFGTQLGGLGVEIGQGRTMSGDVLDVIRLAPNAAVLVVAAVPRPIGVAPASPRALLRALELQGTAQQVGGTDAADQPLAVDPSR